MSIKYSDSYCFIIMEYFFNKKWNILLKKIKSNDIIGKEHIIIVSKKGEAHDK